MNSTGFPATGSAGTYISLGSVNGTIRLLTGIISRLLALWDDLIHYVYVTLNNTHLVVGLQKRVPGCVIYPRLGGATL
ncbi:hypothetical protein AcW1_008027 [Taiwanofungus camphoratus]|nr:hypothetical protein AcW1_008027 [Antrodia cinnamomea]KAI0955742.1 hypothetical protein AcV7_006321 [Antrodia cinnamomea]